MPAYDFVCPQGHLFEQRARTDERLTRCPVCGHKATRKFTLISPDQIRIHGGFHINRSQVSGPHEPKVWALGAGLMRLGGEEK